MSALIFSSWNGKVLDNRKAKAVKSADVNIPTQLNGETFSAMMGWNGMVVADSKADIPALALGYLKQARQLSCGECSVCSIGIDKITDILEKFLAGQGSDSDLDEAGRIIEGVTEMSKCNFGRASAVLPVLDALKHFKADFIAAVSEKKKPAKKEYASTVTAPCQAACPASLDIAGYIEFIRNNKFTDSLNLIREKCILPGVIGRACTHPCESACVRNDVDETLAIRLLKRAAADFDLQQGGAGLGNAVAKKSDKVAIVGAGPAGLAAAYHLRRMGYGVIIFESLPRPGGMAAVGIPDYRLPKDILNHEVDLIRRMGVEIRYDKKIDKLDLNELKKQGFKAVYLAVGAHVGTKIGCAGEDQGLQDFVDGAVFLRKMNLGGKIEPKTKVVIIGGGNVALDCARSCLRLGFGKVEILYRRTRAEMPANKEEIEAALEEGIKIRYLAAPVNVIAKDGTVTAIECLKMKLGEPDSSGRRRPVPIKESEFKVAADTVIAATGQVPDLGFAATKDAVKSTKWGTIEVDPVTFQTSIKGVFAGGDCVSGPATLIEALDAGNKTALSIDAYLRGKAYKAPVSFKDIDVNKQRYEGFICNEPQAKVKSLEMKKRLGGFAEVEGCFSEAEAMKEASRCLRCYRLVVWE
jgi:formate dehydrogenase (NADP+) beta subunit